MSKLTALLDELCPDGVEYVETGKIARIGTGSSDRKDAVDDGEYPFFVRSETVMRHSAYEYDETAIVIPGEGGVGEIFHYVSGKYALHQRAYRVNFTTDTIDTRYAYYYFQAYFKRFIERVAVTATVKSIRKPMLTKFPIPVPPLEVQQEIVRLLDTFTDLEQSLVSELELRKKQLIAQRDRLLGEGVEQSTLGEEFSMKAGKFVKAAAIAQEPSDENPYPCYGANGLRGYVSHMTHEGDYVLVGRQGALSGNTLRVSGRFAATEHAVVVSPLESDDFDVDWVYHKLTALNLNKYVTKGAQPGLSVRTLQGVPIGVDTPVLQRSVAERLGLFESLINSIEQEIILRRKQYEFYRDELLSFTPKEA